MFSFGNAAIQFQFELLKNERKDKSSGNSIYTNGDSVCGYVTAKITSNKIIPHEGICIELVAQCSVEKNVEESSIQKKSLDEKGSVELNEQFSFNFENVQFPFESYYGRHLRFLYFLRVTMTRNGYATSDVISEFPFHVQILKQQVRRNKEILMEVGIEDCLHLEFTCNKTEYHLNDIIEGKVQFLLVRIKMKRMEIGILRKEKLNSKKVEMDAITKYEIMDGAVVKGEVIPVRIFLSHFQLTPTYVELNEKYDVRYFLNVVLYDQDDRRYFKQHEVILYRNALG